MKRLLSSLIFVAVAAAPVWAQVDGALVPAPVEDVNRVTDLTLDSLNKAASARPVAGSSRVGDNPVLFLVGNSTMRTGTLGNGNNGQWGWGYFAHLYFDERRITVENHALGGTSSRTFYRRLWPDVLKGIRPGDWVIIELGHNDNGPYDSGRARASIPGTGTDSLVVTIQETGVQETVFSYGEYMRRFILDVRSRGAFPVLCSLTPRRSWEADGTISRKTETFTRWQKEVCAEMNVPFIDLEAATARQFETFGAEKVSYHFYLDNIHSSEFGARLNARSAAEAIAACPGLALAAYLTPRATWYPAYPAASDDKPTVYFCGDSTMQNEDDPSDPNSMWGWANPAITSALFRLDRQTRQPLVHVVGAAKAGRSARTYLEEGRWEQVYNSLRPGDYVVLQFGHNDMGDIAGGKARADIAGVADSSHVYRLKSDFSYKVVYTYGWYLRKFVRDAREKGAIPIICSMTPRNEWSSERHNARIDGRVATLEGKANEWSSERHNAEKHTKSGIYIERRPGSAATWAAEVAAELDVPFVDIHNLTADYLDKHCSARTPEASKAKANAYYSHDHTHTSFKGARLNASMFAAGLRQTTCPLKDLLK